MHYIIGDIHSNVNELERLLQMLHLKHNDTLIFVGDYINKLPHTQATIVLLLSLNERYNCIFLRGNHEFVWNDYIRSGSTVRQEFLLHYGGKEALQEFDESVQHALVQNDTTTLEQALSSYIQLMRIMKDWHIEGKYLVLHAGLLSEQYEQSPLIFQEKNFFIRSIDIPFKRKYLGHYTLVGGHTFLSENPTMDEGYINIDLGAGYGKYIGALSMEDQAIIRSDGKTWALPQ